MPSTKSLPILIPKIVQDVFKLLSIAYPNPQSDLEFSSDFQLLIAVILSAQATDVSVNRVTPDLFKAAPTPEGMIKLGEKEIKHHIRSIGLSNNKAHNIFKTCSQLIEKYHSQVPETREELEQLAGVGPKTAGVVLNIAFNEPEIPVDTHVFRLANRLGLVKTKNVNATEKQLKKIIPDWVINKAHHLLILHGRYICKARKPLCDQCCVVVHCNHQKKSSETINHDKKESSY